MRQHRSDQEKPRPSDPRNQRWRKAGEVVIVAMKVAAALMALYNAIKGAGLTDL